jgi:hypothetical protein
MARQNVNQRVVDPKDGSQSYKKIGTYIPGSLDKMEFHRLATLMGFDVHMRIKPSVYTKLAYMHDFIMDKTGAKDVLEVFENLKKYMRDKGMGANFGEDALNSVYLIAKLQEDRESTLEVGKESKIEIGNKERADSLRKSSELISKSTKKELSASEKKTTESVKSLKKQSDSMTNKMKAKEMPTAKSEQIPVPIGG